MAAYVSAFCCAVVYIFGILHLIFVTLKYRWVAKKKEKKIIIKCQNVSMAGLF